jgi:septum formation protein
VAPRYEEHDPPDADPLELVRRHAREKARSVADEAGERPVLAVDTSVVLERRVYGKPRDAADAAAMLEVLSGNTHRVVSGLCLRTPAWEELRDDTTLVSFRSLTARHLARYLASEEWRDRAGAYAIQGLGASLVERIEGDYLNVVGLPGALLIDLLGERFAGTYGFG